MPLYVIRQGKRFQLMGVRKDPAALSQQVERPMVTRLSTSKSGSATLTANECTWGLVLCTNGPTITLPAATASLAGADVIVSNVGAGSTLTVTVAAGFGGLGASYDTLTLSAGQSCRSYCDGSNWHLASAHGLT